MTTRENSEDDSIPTLSDLLAKGISLRAVPAERTSPFFAPDGFISFALRRGGVRIIHWRAILSFGPEIENAETCEFVTTALRVEGDKAPVEVIYAAADIARVIAGAQRQARRFQ